MAYDIQTSAKLTIQHIQAACDPNMSARDAIDKLKSAHACFERIQKVNDQKKFGQSTILGNIAHAIAAFQSGDQERIQLNREILAGVVKSLESLTK